MLLDDVHFSQSDLLAGLQTLPVDLAQLGKEALLVTDVTLNSRNAKRHRAFIALRGYTNDGHAYIADAIEKGCKLVLSERQLSPDVMQQALLNKCTVLVVAKLKDLLPTLLSALYKRAMSAKITAVTGTNGKTSVASLFAQLALVRDKKSASLGTLGLNIYTLDKQKVAIENAQLSVNTTPDIVSHYKVLSHLEQHDIDEYCLEASSHGIEQQRLAGLPIETAIFTNLSQDHLDYHQTLAAYAHAKRGLLAFDTLKNVVLNADDPESLQWMQSTPNHVRVAWYGLNATNLPKQAEHYCIATDVRCTESGIDFQLSSSWGKAKLSSPLFGIFNVSNLLAAICARLLQGDTFAALIERTKIVIGVPGRMELFVNNSNKANLIVDYAHTPDALQQALIAARQHTVGKLFCVFGCGGDRDKSKRPLMGAAASQYSDVVVLTQDNSRHELPSDIVHDIRMGIADAANVHVELDRQAAIRWAWEQSSQQDLILLAGKGHEDYLEINDQRLSYSERAFAQQLSAEAAV